MNTSPLQGHIMTKEYEVCLEEAEEGGYVVTCPALPGCISEGETREEAVANIRDAIEGYLESLRKHGMDEPKGKLRSDQHD